MTKVNKIDVLLSLADNMLGPLKPDIIKRVKKYLKRPTVNNWEDIHCIIINQEGTMRTIWNAVRDIDPFFPGWGRSTDYEGNVLREWERIPTPEQVIKAIERTVLKKQTINN